MFFPPFKSFTLLYISIYRLKCFSRYEGLGQKIIVVICSSVLFNVVKSKVVQHFGNLTGCEVSLSKRWQVLSRTSDY